MWHSAGICRTQTVMESAIATIKTWQNEFKNWEISQYLLNLKSQHTVQFLSPENAEYLKSLAEILNLLDIAHLILKSAVFRTESRGGHYRLDYPKTHSEWQIHTVIKGDCCTSIPTRRD
jgi:L-aspartate oxidase